MLAYSDTLAWSKWCHCRRAHLYFKTVPKLEGNLPTGSTTGPPLTILPPAPPPPGALSSLLWSLEAEWAEGVAATARETPTPAARPDAALGSPEPSACED